MTEQINLVSKFHKETANLKIQEFKISIDDSKIISNSFDIEIIFTIPILEFRNHDYKWVDLKKSRIAADYSPKILKLENGYYVQANLCEGIWETDIKNPKKLLWRFNPDNSKTITHYSGNSNNKKIEPANNVLKFLEKPSLLFSRSSAFEISRSKIPFTAVACFTDHCDFDTLENLQAQRGFLKSNNIKVTKGFFLNHFSKRLDNASAENHRSEFELWESDGHELCYHSLSQSIKSDEKSFDDFKNFTPPFPEIPVWIDHGYQPYNLSLFQNKGWAEAEYEDKLNEKKIKILWNYIDSGTSTEGVINQLNPQHFTLKSYLKGNRNLGNFKLAQAMIKNIVFHYINDENILSKYKQAAQHFKKIVYNRQLSAIFPFMIFFLPLTKSIICILFSWSKHKNIPYRLAEYTPLFFRHTIKNREFTIFQTVEMIDFSKSLSKHNIDLLIKEKGIFIAHTYFSDSIAYHQGKLLNSENKINENVVENFTCLSEMIQQKKIWNPTLTELHTHLEEFKTIVFDVDKHGSIFVKNNTSIAIRMVD